MEKQNFSAPAKGRIQNTTQEQQDTAKELRLKAGMTTGSRKQTYNGFADSARRMTNFRSGHEETRKLWLSAIVG
jgi:hypothetical protein